MPDPWYPGARRNPGVNAGYRAGRTTMQSVVCHYTVGRNSTGIGQQGYFQFLVSRDGTVQQFAEVDAVCWHAGSPWNGLGPGVEIEYLDEPTIFTPEADAATAALVDWLVDTWGVPRRFYDGPRIQAYNGFITHRSLIQTGDAHSDYWPYLPGDPMAEVDLTLKALNDIRNVVGGQPNLDGSIPVLSQIVRDLLRIEQKLDALAASQGGTPGPLHGTWTTA